MIRFLYVIIFLVGISIDAYSQTQNDEDAIKTVIKESYVDGVHKMRDHERIKKGFHKNFRMSVKTKEGEIILVTLDNWLSRMGTTPSNDEIDHEFLGVDISKTSAQARIQLYRNKELIYTDFFSLYKFEDGWKIVGKIFQSHK